MALVDYFLKIDTIEGESQDQKHKNEIQLLSFSFGEQNAGSFAVGSGGGSGKVQMQDFHFTMNTCKASPKLFSACATGQHIPSATLTARKAGKNQEDYFIATFKQLLVSSWSTSGHAEANHLPIDTCSFNFTELLIEYKLQNADGSVTPAGKAGYNLKEMKSS
jgi:type VI secretion system secreted protein Hcp